MSQTKIEWCDKVWNPITGCSPVSGGCANCYAKRMANRLKGRYGYPQDDPFKVTFHPDRLDEPLHWKKPCRIFVCSMGDLFHPKVLFHIYQEISQIIDQCPQHTFLLLTKRPQTMRDTWIWQYPNLWLGVSVEDQKTADERIPILLQIPAAYYWISHEPGLGMVTYPKEFLSLKNRAWLVTGGETGPKARPMHPDIPRHDRDQCQSAGVPFFFKSWGEWGLHNDHFGAGLFLKPDGSLGCQGDSWDGNVQAIRKVGKKNAGRLLDGKIWEEYPS